MPIAVDATCKRTPLADIAHYVRTVYGGERHIERRPEYRAAIILLAYLIVTRDVRELASYTSYSTQEVTSVLSLAQASGFEQPGRLAQLLDDRAGPVQVLTWGSVGAGYSRKVDGVFCLTNAGRELVKREIYPVCRRRGDV